MQFKFTTGAAVLLALTPSVLAGTAHVINNCGVPVYYASVVGNASPAMQLLPSGGYSQVYSGNGVGVSIKLAPQKTGPITQLEFTLSGTTVAYDMSNIDGNPFAAGGMTLTPSMGADSKNPTCIPVNCPAGQAVCTAAYNQPNDVRTLVCNSASDLTLTLCTAGHMKREEIEAPVPRLHARQFPKLA